MHSDLRRSPDAYPKTAVEFEKRFATEDDCRAYWVEADTVLAEFAEATKLVLLRRIRNQPASRIWQEGWLNRIATYRTPLVTTMAPAVAIKQR